MHYKYNNINYLFSLIGRVRSFHNSIDSELKVFFKSIISKPLLILTAWFFAIRIIRKNKIIIKNYKDLTKIEFLLVQSLLKKDIFLYPSYVFYPNRAQIITNLDCNFRCEHCYQKKYTKNKIKLKTIKLFVCKLKKLNIKHMSILGGEPFLYTNLLNKVVKECEKNKIKVSVITSNGFWLKNKQKTEKLLINLKKGGFSGNIIISTGICHLKFFPNINKLKYIKKISKKIFKKNVFSFCFEDISKKEYKKNIKKINDIKKKFIVRYRAIVPIGHGNIYYSIKKSKKNLYLNKLNCVGLRLNYDGKISYCLNYAPFEESHHLTTLTKKTDLKKIFKKEDKKRIILSRFKGYKIVDVLVKNNKIREDDFPHFCNLCVYLSENPKLIDFLYGELVTKNKSYTSCLYNKD